VATEGYDALTIRRVAAVLGTGPSSLYAHIVSKEDIDDLLVGRLCSEVVLPEPDPAMWHHQIRDVYAQIRDGRSPRRVCMGATPGRGSST
jgi:AcrR family transcriptional regulator